MVSYPSFLPASSLFLPYCFLLLAWVSLSPVSGFPQLSSGAYLLAENSQDRCKCSGVWVGDVHVLGTAPGIVRSEPGVASRQHDLQPATGCVGAVGCCHGGTWAVGLLYLSFNPSRSGISRPPHLQRYLPVLNHLGIVI